MTRGTRSIYITIVGMALAICANRAAAEDASSEPTTELPPAVDKPIDFIRDVQPILNEKCVDCHGPDSQEGQLRLDARATVFRGGVSGPVVVAEKSAESLLVQRIAGRGDLDRMPLGDDPLSAEQIGVIRAWIEQGAHWPADAGADVEAADEHWAYVKPIRPAAPPVKQTEWVQNPIDAFILAKLEQEGVAPSPRADKARLIRRVTLDLTGIPPTLAEVDAFLADDSPRAYDRVVDRLLATPGYGERWAIPWLDAARYADSNGYQRDGRREVWAYRDWVVRALNIDMPFDRFTIEQIAGDLLPDATLSQRVATGFHRGTMANVEAGTDPEEEHVLAVIDRVNTTGTVWLGTTIECAQCHNHKYDPFTQKDYYRLYAFFNNTEKEIESFANESRREFVGPKVELPLAAETRQRRKDLKTQIADAKAQIDELTERLKAEQDRWEENLGQQTAGVADAEKLPKPIRAILAIAPDERTEKQQADLTAHYLSQSEDLQAVKKQMQQLRDQFAETKPPTTLVMQELPEPRETMVFKRGDFLNPGETVEAGTPAVLHRLDGDDSPSRLALARWLVDEDNPLVARVTVNRYWQEFFGRGLVASAEDFGTQGTPPTHPELLDWLATEFVRLGWSTKSLHRLIVTSAAYQQDSRVTPELLQADPENRLYARGPRYRLKAEFIRDNALAIAGLLSNGMTGPPVFPKQPDGVWNHTGRASNHWPTSEGDDQYRRGLYVYWRRTVPYPSLVNFDAPSREACSVTRSRSNTPLQALTLLNDPVYFEAAVALAERMVGEPGQNTSIEDRIAFGFRLATARDPRPAEQNVLAARYRAELLRYQNDEQALQAILKSWTAFDGAESARFAALIHVANVILNLDEVITKG